MNNNYARISTRVKAAILDGIILIVLMYSTTEIFNLFDSIPNSARIIAFVSIFLLYEPILLSIFGATIGHFFNDIVVKQISNENKNITLPIAIIRFLLKTTLGWLSLLTISTSKKGQAIHDYVSKSVVIPYKSLS